MSVNNIAYIPLSDTELAIVDLDDLPKLLHRAWFVQWSKGYPVCKLNNKQTLMHRLLIDVPAGMQVDHINGNKFDNRKINLRVCTNAQNTQNRIKKGNSTSGFVGAHWHKNSSKWSSYITLKGNRKYLGYFRDKYDAATAYNFAAAELHREFAVYNIVPQPWLEAK